MYLSNISHQSNPIQSSLRFTATKDLKNDCRRNKRISGWIFVLLLHCVIPCLSSCYLPPVLTSDDNIDSVDAIKPGVTTKEEVVQKFGKPFAKNPDESSIIYFGVKNKGAIWIPMHCGGGECGLVIDPDSWSVVIQFDANDVVTNVSTNRYITFIANSGHGVSNSVNAAKQAGIYCPNADLGHADAQVQIGDIFYHGRYNLKVDLVRACVWYRLAARNGDPQASEQVSRITTELTSEQLEEAKQQLANWQPGQCMQELAPGGTGTSEWLDWQLEPQ
jgi:hypothetical protein